MRTIHSDAKRLGAEKRAASAMNAWSSVVSCVFGIEPSMFAVRTSHARKTDRTHPRTSSGIFIPSVVGEDVPVRRRTGHDAARG